MGKEIQQIEVSGMSSGDLEVDEPKVKTTSIAAIMTSLPSTAPMLDNGGHDLLADPTLVENYSDILKKKPDRLSNGASGGSGSVSDYDGESVSGSVVVTKSSANTSPAKQRSSMLSNSSSHYSLRGNDIQPCEPLEDTVEEMEEEEDKELTEEEPEKESGQVADKLKKEQEEIVTAGSSSSNRTQHVDENTIEADEMGELRMGDMSHDYEYSDSDFEDDLEKRLQDLNASDSALEHNSDLREDADSDHMILGLSLSEDENSDSDDKLHLGLDDNLEDDSDSDDYQPLSPPKELDPEKLYALYAFNGPDPSHCQLRQDESCTLLNDQDSYWWLVRRSYDSKIGFAPAEILETFPERLARLNCWKNENMASLVSERPGNDDKDQDGQDSKPSSSDAESNTNQEQKGNKSSVLKDYIKDNKSVSFNDVVSYADRYVEEDVGSDDAYEAAHYDEFTEADLNLNRLSDDDLSEVVSDVSFNTGAMVPLNMEKVRRPKNPGESSQATSRAEESAVVAQVKTEEGSADTRNEADDLHKIFEAPIAPFNKSHDNGNRMQTSNSDYSISTIGDFSPSSSEWTNDSPQLPNEHFGTQPDNSAIPSSRAIQDFSKYVEEDEEEKVQVEEQGDDTIDETISQDVPTEPKNDSDKPGQNNSLHGSKQNSITSTSSMSDQIFMDSEGINSFTSINSTASVSKHSSQVKSKRHPMIDRLYNPLLDKMDELMRLLDEVANE